ncbi:MAG: hypothetical protein NTV51_02035 [Verrucomicrobia bacterium]|nr:hypothetical protein [Verrucomicrobiota bacterium]
MGFIGVIGVIGFIGFIGRIPDIGFIGSIPTSSAECGRRSLHSASLAQNPGLSPFA